MAVGDEEAWGPAQPYRHARGELGRLVILRLPPDADVYHALREVARQEGISSGVILSGVGSLKKITLRNVRLFPDEFPIQDRHRIYITKTEPLELLTLTGSISQRDGATHVHAHAVISSGLEEAAAYGGHLVEGCIVFSTVEIIIGAIHGIAMTREMDPQTRVIELCFAREDQLPSGPASKP